mgnify:FL=1
MKDPHAVALGRKGGLVTSDRKRAAIIKNLKKARAALRQRYRKNGVDKAV